MMCLVGGGKTNKRWLPQMLGVLVVGALMRFIFGGADWVYVRA